METETCEGGELTEVDMGETTFNVTVSGCSPGTYTYTWQKSSDPNFMDSSPGSIGSGTSLDVMNLQQNGTYYTSGAMFNLPVIEVACRT